MQPQSSMPYSRIGLIDDYVEYEYIVIVPSLDLLFKSLSNSLYRRLVFL